MLHTDAPLPLMPFSHAKQGAQVCRWLAAEKGSDVVMRAKASCHHAVDVERAVEMVALVLGDARRPAGQAQVQRAAVLVQSPQADTAVADYQRRISCHRQAAFEKDGPSAVGIAAVAAAAAAAAASRRPATKTPCYRYLCVWRGRGRERERESERASERARGR